MEALRLTPLDPAVVKIREDESFEGRAEAKDSCAEGDCWRIKGGTGGTSTEEGDEVADNVNGDEERREDRPVATTR